MIINCYSTGSVIGSGNQVGGLCAFIFKGTVDNCFWDTETSGMSGGRGGVGLSTEMMQRMSTYSLNGWGGEVWTINDGNDYPHLAWENAVGAYISEPVISLEGSGTEAEPYRIGSVDDLVEVSVGSCYWDKYLVLGLDLDVGGINLPRIGHDSDHSFTGVLDGRGHGILNLTIDAPTYFVGLFGCIGLGGEVKNLGVEDVNISGGTLVGGLCGYNDYGGRISNCYSTGNVTGSEYDVGGLCGSNRGAISSSYSNSRVTGDYYVGGLSGANSGTVANCYATRNTTGTGCVGGLCGSNYGGRISNSYSVGSASGQIFAGAIAGCSDNGIYEGCFWDSEVAGDVNGIGETNDPNVMARTTGEMQTSSTFTDAGWDLVGEAVNGPNDVWRMCWDGGWYPRLAWQFYQWGDFVCPERVDLKDFSYLVARWGQTDCAANNNCDGADLDYSGVVDRVDLRMFSGLWLKGRPAPGELAVPAGVDLADYAKLASRWLNRDCWLTHNCYAVDLDFSGVIDWGDFKILCEQWLEGW
jgi:hypothetical protein